MRILLTGRFVNEKGNGGGSGSFFKILNNGFLLLGHETVLTSEPEKFLNRHFDLIISSHEKLNVVRQMDAFKIHVCHGAYEGPESPREGADKYVAVSEQVQNFLKEYGYESEVIRQPIEVFDFMDLPREGNILFIKNNGTDCLQWWKNIPKIRRFFRESEIWGIKDIIVAKRNVPINEQILKAKIVISLGRGALEAMALSRCVIVADNRRNIGLKGDGYLDGVKAENSMKYNYNGNAYGFEATREWLLNEIRKFNPETAKELHEHVIKYHEVKMIAEQYIELMKKNAR